MRCSLLFIGQQIIRSEVEASEILMILRSSYNKRCILIQKAVMTSLLLTGWELPVLIVFYVILLVLVWLRSCEIENLGG